MLLSSIKKFAKTRKTKTNPSGTPSRSVYGVGIGLGINVEPKPAIPDDIPGSVDGGDGGGGE